MTDFDPTLAGFGTEIGDGYFVTGTIGQMTIGTECDAADGGRYMFPDGSIRCRCVVCSRCGHHTGNSNQGHYWKYCKVTKAMRTFHLCCPGDCELEAQPIGEAGSEATPNDLEPSGES